MNKKFKDVSITLLLSSLIIMMITFVLSSSKLNVLLFLSYFKSPRLLLLNFLPILIILILVYLISNKIWLGYLITSLFFIVMGTINQLKLACKDYPLMYTDIKHLGESIKANENFDTILNFKKIIILIFILVCLLAIVIAVTLKLKEDYDFKINSNKTRLGSILSLIIVSILIFNINGFYFNPDIYKKIGDENVINKWIESQRIQSKGFVYTFIYSIQGIEEEKPEGYDEQIAKNELFKYTYKNIDDDKKVNVISIMLEAYNDFSKFEDVDLNVDIYENFHKIQEESLSGNLVSNVFSGGTINTERAFLTGYHNEAKCKDNTNSFVWYFSEQGYRTEAMHPITGSFYDRRNVNRNIGFDKFDYYENKYEKVQEEYLKDMIFFDYLIEGFENSVNKGVPYFNYTITFQNHGPYSKEKMVEKEYLKRKENYNDEDYNIINNYMSGISETDAALKKFFDYFRNSNEPTIIVIFGDHNPWLGDKNSVYDMLNINLDLKTVDGFENYYETPYIIWGNDAAKKNLNRNFVGKGKDLSPNQLMPELFDYVGWEGNEYMQYAIDMKKSLPVNHDLYFKENNRLVPKDDISKKSKDLWQNFLNVEYYTKTHFSNR